MRATDAGLQLLQRCRAAGWTYRVTTKGHVLVTTDSGATFTFAPASREPRATHNALANARRLGLDAAEACAARVRQRRRAGSAR